MPTTPDELLAWCDDAPEMSRDITAYCHGWSARARIARVNPHTEPVSAGVKAAKSSSGVEALGPCGLDLSLLVGMDQHAKVSESDAFGPQTIGIIEVFDMH